MQGTRVASRYAKAFIDLALEQGLLEQAYNDMKFILNLCESNHDFAVFLKSPVIKTEKKQAVLKQIFEGKLNKITDDFIMLMSSKKREIYFIETALEFINQYKDYKKILTAVVTTAKGIDDDIRKKVMAIVKGSGNSEVVLEEKINENIIGGFILRVGDNQVDASIARKLNDLKRSFKENPFIKEI
jgi:F-type H+-transporting ATPase subunit delta